MSGTPVHDWLRPRLTALVAQAERAGFDRETVVAVLTDLITSPPYNRAAAVDSTDASTPDV